MHRQLPTFAMAIALGAGCSQPIEGTRDGVAPDGFAGSGGGFVGSGGQGGRGATGTGGLTGPGGPAGAGGGPIVQPFTEPIVVADSPPPPVSGGTLAVVSSGHVAVVSDPDRDQMVIVDLDTVKVRIQVALQKGDEPGRIVEDGVGHVHVVLRGAGALITIEPSTGLLLERRSVCTHPRGLAYDGANDSLHLACAGGQLVSLPAAGGAPTRQLALDADLRDVVVDGSRLLVSRFRSAELLVVEADGSVSGHLAPPSVTLLPPTPTGGSLNADGNAFSPAVAWRTTGAPGGGALMVFQEEQTSPVVPSTGGYGSRCGSVVRTGVCVLRADGTGWTVVSLPAILPIDVVATPAGLVELISASTSKSPAGLNVSSIIGFTPPTSSNPVDTGPCARSTAVTSPALTIQPDSVQASGGQVVAIAYDGQGRRLIQTRDPYLLFVGTTPVTLPGQSQKDTGHELFHLGTLGGLACASCHPEGRDDGHVWTFAGIGPRRTQSIRGGILGTEPFHWNGDMTNFDVLAHEVFGNRMSGPSLTTAYIQTLAGFIDQLPAMKPEPVLDSASVDRGRAIFQDPTVACATCHAGSKMTNNATVDVGTGGPFQVPSLVGVAWRAPYLHSGCASTLEARFGDCGGGELHGHTSQLIPSGRADLVAYLRSL